NCVNLCVLLKRRLFRFQLDQRVNLKHKRRNTTMAFGDNPNLQRAEKATVGVLSGFKSFILRGYVVDLAIGIMIGAVFSGVVNSLVSDVITPLIPGIGKGLTDSFFTVPWTGS